MRKELLLIWEKDLDNKEDNCYLYLDELRIMDFKSLDEGKKLLNNLIVYFSSRKEDCIADFEMIYIENRKVFFRKREFMGRFDSEKNEWIEGKSRI